MDEVWKEEPVLVLQGEEANLRIMAEEIEQHAELGGACTAAITARQDRQAETFGHGVLAEITVTVLSGVLTATISDVLKVLIARARDRGEIKEVNQETSSVGEQTEQ